MSKRMSIGSKVTKKQFLMLHAAAAAGLGTLLGTPPVSFAGTNGVYSDATTGGSWSTATNWVGSQVANGTDGIANFSNIALTASNTVHLDSSRTIGQLTFGDLNNTYGWTLDNGGSAANVLTLATSTSLAPVINVVNQSANISTSLAGTQGFTLAGGGVLTLSGNNSYTGVTNVSSGTLVLGASASSSSSFYNTGLQVDLDPTLSTVNTSGGAITYVSDLSGNSNAATAGYGSVTLSTINGHKAFSFSSSGLSVGTYSAKTNPGTVIAIVDPTSVSGPSAIVGANDGANAGGLELRLYNSKLDALDAATADYGSSTSTVSANALSVVGYAFNSSAASFYLNGASIGSGSVPSFTGSGTLTVGYKATNSGPSAGAGGEFFAGTMGTVLVYNTALTASQIQSVSSYLASEYAASSTTLGNTEVLLSSPTSNLSLASASQSISSLAGVTGSNVYLGGGILTVGSDGTSTLYAGNISDTGTGSVGTGGQLIKVGGGTLTLSGSVTNTGGTQVNAGTLLVSGTYATSGASTVTGGSLTLSGTDSASGNFSIGSNGTLVLSGVGTSAATGSITFSSGGLLTLAANASNITGSGASATSSAIGNPANLTYADAATTNVQLLSDSSVTFANSSPSGGTGSGAIINYFVNPLTNATNQTLYLSSSSTNGTTYATYYTTINVSGSNGYTLDIPAISNANEAPLTLNASTGNLSIPGGINFVGTLTVSGSSNTSLGAISGTGPLLKSGAGVLSLIGANNYTGATTISGGTVVLTSTGALTATSGISIASGANFDITANPAFALPASTATLSGSGTILGSYNHSIGILSPGTAPGVGTLTVNGDLTLSGGAVDLVISGSNNSTGGVTNDLVNVTGGLDLIGNTTLTLGPVSPTLPSGTIWTVLTYNTSSGDTSLATGSLNVSSSAFAVVPINTTPGKVEIEYLSGTVGLDLWTGSQNSSWDTSTPNFVPVGGSSAIAFTNGDSVLFNDSSSVSTVNLSSGLLPSSVTVNSNVTNYTFNGGPLSGSATLTKLGTSTLTISGSNTYTGGTNISGGVVVLNNTTGVGLGTGPLFIASGAALYVGDGGTDGILNTGQLSTITDNGLLAYNSSTSNFSPPSPLTGTGSLYLNVESIGIGNVNNYSGGTTVAGGQVTAYEATSFGTGTVVVNGGEIINDYGKTFPNNFNLSGNAIETGGNTTGGIAGTTYIAGATTIFTDGGSSMVFGSAVSGNGSNLLLNTSTGASVTFDGNVALGTGTLQSSGPTYFTPAASTTLTVSLKGITDNGASSTLVQNGLGTTVLNGSNTYTGGTNVTSGTLVFNSPNALPNFSALTISAGAIADVANHSGGTKNTLFASSLSLDPAGKLDLGNNDMVVQNGSLTSITSAVATGYASGKWNATTGIVSSAAAADTTHLHALGVILNTANGVNPLYSSFDGATSSAITDVLVKYTYYGDTNLDGKVDGTDYSRIDSSFASEKAGGPAVTGWFNGDFNYDNIVDGSDYTLIDNAFNSQGVQILSEISAESATPTAIIAQAAPSFSVVPEPASLGLLSVGAMGLLARRRRSAGRGK